ncbi:hypothetical protein IN842_15475 [Mycobacteroides abscessus subsp. abscessus]|uniref:Uncharacterized protein n=1 Tax=Mycobacteroides immunogenum TaxID=83262 RepID=A0ABR5LJD6_9MYCO|nr:MULTISPECIES: hypothetical protein [Mycobacteroides]MDM2402668.1 hypothetical protein [Mycobacteroides abscessus]KPG25082.1 hypothetical protein AN912_27735 [Mycobacteroides immunogenum]KPG29281.1 hypothetical protein AN913_11360 [Mycobacteroides immunogenum]KPG56438.1 hypothetical protein AN918_27600 [Mycobacteroides immunogenum]MDM2412985.1 hypothetical protein [Mycobacteroides abscessus]
MTNTEEPGHVEVHGGDNTISIDGTQALAETIDALDALAKDELGPQILELLKIPGATDGSSTNADVIEIINDIAAKASANNKAFVETVEELRAWAAVETGTQERAGANIAAGEG